MAISQKILRFEYQSKLNVTGLTDVKGQFYLNGVAKAVGANALTFVEVDAVNAKGLYEVTIPAATLTSWGVVAGQSNTVTGYINSASLPAQAIVKVEQTITNLDDLSALIGTPAGATVSADIAAVQTKLGTPAGASVSVDVAAVKADTAAIKADLESGGSSLANILAAVQQLQNASIENGVGFVLPTMAIPKTGSQIYKVPITIEVEGGGAADPLTNTVTVGAQNQSGTDRGSYITGATGSPATATATRTGTGQYYVMLSIPANAPEEELVFSFAYTLNSKSYVRYGVSILQNAVSMAGYSSQTSVDALQATANTISGVVGNATYGNSALQALLANPTYGLAAQQTIEAAIQSAINNATYGLSAQQQQNVNILAALNNGTYGLAALQALDSATQGVGFTAGLDDLRSIGVYLRANLFVGGKAQ